MPIHQSENNMQIQTNATVETEVAGWKKWWSRLNEQATLRQRWRGQLRINVTRGKWLEDTWRPRIGTPTINRATWFRMTDKRAQTTTQVDSKRKIMQQRWMISVMHSESISGRGQQQLRLRWGLHEALINWMQLDGKGRGKTRCENDCLEYWS